MFEWVAIKYSKLWKYVKTSVESGRAVAAVLSIFSALIVIALLASFFISPKPWIVQFWQSLVGIVTGGSIGAIIGLVLGGIGIAIAGTAVGIAGWIIGAILGATIGGIFGLLTSFITNPAAYTFNIVKFLPVLLLALLVAYLVWKVVLFTFTKIRSWRESKG